MIDLLIYCMRKPGAQINHFSVNICCFRITSNPARALPVAYILCSFLIFRLSSGNVTLKQARRAVGSADLRKSCWIFVCQSRGAFGPANLDKVVLSAEHSHHSMILSPGTITKQ